MEMLALAFGSAFLLFGQEPLAEKPLIELVDDRGKLISAAVSVCFGSTRRPRCVHWEGSGPLQVPENVEPGTEVRIEGPRHGPLSLSWRELLAGSEEGPIEVYVPAKTPFRIEAESRSSLRASFYELDCGDCHEPAWRFDLRPGETVWVPAGDHLLSVSDGVTAPNLWVVTAQPSKALVRSFRPREGWSAAIRVSSGGAPVEKPRLHLTPSSGYDSVSPLVEARAVRHGFGLLVGVTSPLLEVSVEASGYLRYTGKLSAASRGGFTIYDLELTEPARLSVQVLLDSEPLREAECTLFSYVSRHDPDKLDNPVAAARSDRAGICLLEHLEAVPVFLRVHPPESLAGHVQRVTLQPGEQTDVTVDLEKISVTGSVLRDESPVPGYVVEARDISDRSSGLAHRVAQASVDEDGRYELTLWKVGDFVFIVLDDSGSPAASERRFVAGGGDTVDFLLALHGIAGRVMDRSGEGVAEASVSLRSSRGTLVRASTKENGDFSFDLGDEADDLLLQARKEGYRPSDELALPFDPSIASDDIRLVIDKLPVVEGIIWSLAAQPLAGVTVSSTDVGFGSRAVHDVAISDRDGRYRLAATGGLETRLILTGPGCPLQSHDVHTSAAAESFDLVCRPDAGGLRLRIADEQDRSLPGHAVLLKGSRGTVPSRVLQNHLGSLGIGQTTDATGIIWLPWIQSGVYEVYLAGVANEESIALGAPDGRLLQFSLEADQTVEASVQVRAQE